ncbi:hypothetical protein ONZ45_g13005 [Pleurotus djamor]|nr:hypothetical protein ONZ45_g13005 [Pleurotus djamor]
MRHCLFNYISLFVLTALPASQGQVFGTDHAAGKSLTFSSSHEGVASSIPTPCGAIRGATLKRSCLLLTRQAGLYYPPGSTKQQRINFGAFEGKGTDTASNFKDYGAPDGSIINSILDVSASSDIDLEDIWWTTDSTSSCVAVYSCGGNVFKYSYTYEGVICS